MLNPIIPNQQYGNTQGLDWVSHVRILLQMSNFGYKTMLARALEQLTNQPEKSILQSNIDGLIEAMKELPANQRNMIIKKLEKNSQST